MRFYSLIKSAEIKKHSPGNVADESESFTAWDSTDRMDCSGVSCFYLLLTPLWNPLQKMMVKRVKAPIKWIALVCLLFLSSLAPPYNSLEDDGSSNNMGMFLTCLNRFKIDKEIPQNHLNHLNQVWVSYPPWTLINLKETGRGKYDVVDDLRKKLERIKPITPRKVTRDSLTPRSKRYMTPEGDVERIVSPIKASQKKHRGSIQTTPNDFFLLFVGLLSLFKQDIDVKVLNNKLKEMSLMPRIPDDEDFRRIKDEEVSRFLDFVQSYD